MRYFWRLSQKLASVQIDHKQQMPIYTTWHIPTSNVRKFKEKTMELEHLLVAETLDVSFSQRASAANTASVWHHDWIWHSAKEEETNWIDVIIQKYEY